MNSLRFKPHTIKLSSIAKEGEPQFLEMEAGPYGNFITVKIDGKEVRIKNTTLLKAVMTLTD